MSRNHYLERLLGDAASDQFGDTFGSPTLFRSFDLSELPAFPIGLEVHMHNFAVPELHGARVAIGWDGGTVWEGPPQEARTGTIFTIPVNAPRGQTLEVWVDSDHFLDTDVGEVDDVLPLSLADAQSRQQTRNPNENKQGIALPSWALPVGAGVLALLLVGPILIPLIETIRPRKNPRRRRRTRRW